MGITYVCSSPNVSLVFSGNLYLIHCFKDNLDENIQGHEREVPQWNDLCFSKMQSVGNISFVVLMMGEVIPLMDSLSPLQKD